MTELRINGGRFSYDGKKDVLHDINLSVRPGELIAVLGPNGAGKTTLLRCMLGFLRWNGGETLLDGKNVRKLPPRELWRRLAYVPQARNVSAAYTAGETVLLGRSSRMGVFSPPSDEDIAAANSAMERLGILHLADRGCGRLSGGELQMVLIARALAASPEILILDEPESNLDFRNQLIILETLSQLAAEGTACIFNTHYPAHALSRATGALLLSKDGDAVSGASANVITEESIEKAFGVKAVIGNVETPENILKSITPVGLSESNPDREPDKDERIIAVVSVIAYSDLMAEKINGIFHEYGDLIIGRMGMPCHKSGLYIINVTLDARSTEIAALTGRLSALPDISVKTTCEKERTEKRHD